ncbi:MAG: glycosyl transferase, family 2 [Candidatus Acidoferrum typicum]|nr:glycosyl transferase, family 2 [Candidatus Acidoferrum typicum]
MPSASLVVAFISLAIWLYLAVARGGFWSLRAFDDDSSEHEPPTTWPRVVAVIPARNEAATIRQAVSSLLQQNYPGEFSIIVVDDHSEDATAQLAQQAARELSAESRIQICSATSLPNGWTGKLWALNEGVSHAACRGAALLRPSLATNLFWFTDADILHAPDTLHRLVARAERNQLDLTSLMVLLQAKTPPERTLIPAFLFFFLKLYPPSWIANPKAKTAGAAGGCILLRSEALQRIGGLSAIRSEVIDDCALAQAVKRTSGKIWMGLTRCSISLRAYNTFSEIRDMIARTAFTQLRYSPALLLGTIAGMFLTYIAPVALLFATDATPRILAVCAWALMSLLYLPTLRFYSLSPLWAPLLPAVAAFYSYGTILSALRFYRGRGAQWKGRSQASSL